jgi:D-alanine transaminase
MSRIAYVNGRYLPHAEAKVHVEDRGYQFADGVYEVCEVRQGHLVDERRHIERLSRSLGELRIRAPMAPTALGVVMRETLERNRVRDGLVYLQVTRGVARRDHGFPAAETKPSVVVTARSVDRGRADRLAETGIKVVTVPENRWPRVDIKSVALLPNVLARQEALDKGAKEAWFVDADGFITEGASANAWIVTQDDVIVTRSANSGILKGITRTVTLEMTKSAAKRVEERAFSVAEALVAREAFQTSATLTVMPVVEIDGKKIGDGRPGSVARALRARFHEAAEIAS